jgi:hypothetical protein
MRIEIVVEQAEPLSGQVSADGGTPVAFAGWLPLLRILEQLTASARLAP